LAILAKKKYMPYKDLPKRQSTRAKWNEYCSPGFYHLTIVCHNRSPFLGKLSNGRVELSKSGELAHELILRIHDEFPFAVVDAFIIMPDHIHLILELEFTNPPSISPKGGGITGSKNPMLTDSIPKVIRWFKGRFAHDVRTFNPIFKWQPRYYDQIIQSQKQLEHTREYIKTNPTRSS